VNRLGSRRGSHVPLTGGAGFGGLVPLLLERGDNVRVLDDELRFTAEALLSRA
jgi:nucleoside-diphosphate-sugar epimerase